MLFTSCLKLFSFFRYLHFCRNFLVMQEKGLMRKLRLVSKFMTSQTGQQIITTHVFSNIARSKGNKTMKFGQLIEYDVRGILRNNHAENEAGILVPDCFLLSKKAFCQMKASDHHFSLNLFWQNLTWTHNKSESITFQTVAPEICSTLIFIDEYRNSFSTAFCG